MKRILVISVLALGALTACDMGPECLESHSEMQMQPYFKPNGTMEMRPTFVRVCDKYAEESE